VIRITIDSSKGSRLVVEGHLSGSAVDELRKSCATCAAGTVLDLSGLIFADRSGAVLLNELIGDGFVIEGCSSFITELLLLNAGAKVT
jgi:anti-anti-sigma regulatory factor